MSQNQSNHLAELLTELFQALPAGGVPFIILRNYEDLPHSTSNDIDLLVSPETRLRAEVILAETARKCGWRIHNRARFSPVSVFLHHKETLEQIQFDLFTRMEWRGIELIPATELFKHRHSFRGIPIPHPAHEALLNLTGRLLPYGFVRDKYRENIQAVAQRDGAAFEGAAASVFGSNLAAQVRRACAEADWQQLEALHRPLRRSVVLERPAHALRGWAGMALRLTKRFLRPPGMWIVFLGPDGSGKSTCLGRCATLLETTFSPGKSLQLHWKPVPFRKRADHKPGVVNTNPHGKPARPLPLSLAYLCWHWSQFLLGHLTVVKPVMFRNGAVYFDRHYADFLVDPKRFRLSVPRPLLRLFGRLLPQPDLILVNNAPADVLLARKAEVSPDECRRQVASYAGLANELPNTRIIDATLEPEKVAREAESAILEYLIRRTLARHPHLATPAHAPSPPVEAGSPTRLKVLLSAYACEPGRGSEPGVGWNIARELSGSVDLHVITRSNNRRTIESSREPWVGNVTWHFWDPPTLLTFWKKGSRGTQLFYLIWQIGVTPLARKLHEAHRFDLMHHATFGRYWIPSLLARTGCPLVFGPVGGADKTPPDLEMRLGWRGWLSELGKQAATLLAENLPTSRELYRKTAWSLAATPQTARALRNAGATNISILPQSGIEESFGIQSGTESSIPKTGSTRLITACRLVHWKAVDLAIEALSRTPEDLELVILQGGPELENLQQLACNLGVSHRVVFAGRLPTLDDVYREMSHADALIHPAVHEAFGQACLESMALGVPVICLDWAGPGAVVDQDTGFAVPCSDRDTTVQGLASAILRLREEKQNGHSRANACKKRAFSTFGWKSVGKSILLCYDKVLEATHDDRR